MVKITGARLGLPELVRIARFGAKVALEPAARSRVRRCRGYLKKIIDRTLPVYGVTTGFGALAGKKISSEALHVLQHNLIVSHAVGAGGILPGETVRAAICLRINTFARGHSGVRSALVDRLAAFLNKQVVPVVYEQGSVGASGDLAPLAFIALVVIGRGEAFYQGERLPGAVALRRAGIKPLVLEPKEGVALINGTPMMTGLGALTLADGLRLVETAEAAGAMTIAALGGDRNIADPRLHRVRPHPGQVASARLLDRYLAGFEKRGPMIQDAYSLRCIPQVHGGVREAFGFVKKIVETEMNSVTDNPLIFGHQVLSGGNFHGAVVSLAMDTLGIALSILAAISERRIFRLLDPKLSGLAPFLAPDAGLNSGLMMAQVLAAALVSENKILAHPASVDTIPTSANQEDYVNMGMTAALKAQKIYENARTVIALELLSACQALDMTGRRTRPGLPRTLKKIFDSIRAAVPFIESDRELQPLIEKMSALIQEDKLQISS